ncbi:MAG TPA: cation-transporting P-type ATPase, partial [Mycobacteriales bacterium]|nr:cation-transporting P-type ATPase [Mycobacteriales bacterium]
MIRLPVARVAAAAAGVAFMPARAAGAVGSSALAVPAAAAHVVDDAVRAAGARLMLPARSRLPGGQFGVRRTAVHDSEGTRRAHVEVHGVAHPAGQALARAVEAALEGYPGVAWARVNAVLGEAVVGLSATPPGLPELAAVIAGVEAAHGVTNRQGPRAAHPAEPGPEVPAVVGLAADLVGLGVVVAGRLLGRTPLPLQAAVAVGTVDVLPPARAALVRLAGVGGADSLLAVAGGLTQGLAQGSVGLLVDAAARLNALAEGQSRRACWARLEPRLAGAPERAGAPAVVVERPRPLPPGPVDRYVRVAAPFAGAAVAAALLPHPGTRRLAPAAAAALPRAAVLGREGFASQFARVLAARDVLVMDRTVLRILDRVDTVVIDADALGDARHELTGLAPVTTQVEEAELIARVGGLFDPTRPERVVTRDGWTLGPVDAVTGRGRRGVRARRRLTDEGASLVLGLTRGAQLMAVAGVRARLSPVASDVLAAARADGLRVLLAGDPQPLGHLAGDADDVVPGGDQLMGRIRDLQAAGHVVALVSARPPALASADCGLGVCSAGATPPWGAHLMVPDLATATLVLRAIPEARAASARGVKLAALAATAGGGAAALRVLPGSGRWALSVAGLAGAAALASGLQRAVALGRQPLPSATSEEPWHALPPETVLTRLAVGREGLTEDRVDERRQPQPEGHAPVGLARALLEELANPLTPVLAAAAGLSTALGGIVDAGIVVAVAVAGAVIGARQRQAADRAVAGLVATSPLTVRVRRDGVDRRLAVTELVPGDVITLAAG